VATRTRCSARACASEANPVITAVPFINARPSLGASLIGLSFAARSAAAAVIIFPR
jgi:hypothetical protein